jgi:anaerobic selenocysteine-containing dehydrogenase
MSDDQQHRVVYVSHPASGLARSNFPVECHVTGSKIVRSLPFYIPDDVRLYEIKTSRGNFSRRRKEVQMPLAYAWKRRVHSAERVKYPLLRNDWSPDNPNPQTRGSSGYSRISWEQALDIIVGQLNRIREKYGSMEPVLVQADEIGRAHV